MAVDPSAHNQGGMTFRWDDRRKISNFIGWNAFNLLFFPGLLALLVILVPGKQGPGQDLARILVPTIPFVCMLAIVVSFYLNWRRLFGDEVRVDDSRVIFSLAGEIQWSIPWTDLVGYEEFRKSPNREPRKWIGGTALRLQTVDQRDCWFLVNGNNAGDIPDRKILMDELDAHLPPGATRKRLKSISTWLLQPR